MNAHLQNSADHEARLRCARLSLEGLSLGDAFGRNFFFVQNVEWLISSRAIPASPWPYTDDTAMALGIYESLMQHGAIDRDDLALL